MVVCMALTSSVKVKICGIRDEETALAAVAAGADALGFVFAPGLRQVDRKLARVICTKLPPFVSRVGVFVDAPAGVVQETAAYCGLDVVQLHGSETPEYCRQLKYKVVKAFRVRDAGFMEKINYYRCSAVLLDTYVPGLAGGTGRSFDWRLARLPALNRPVILAGGLNPDNIRRALAEAGPYAVDVSSGVETRGKKDLEKISLFIQRAKGR